MLRSALIQSLGLVPPSVRAWVYQHRAVAGFVAPVVRRIITAPQPVIVTVPSGPNRGLRLEIDQWTPRYFWLKSDHDSHILEAMRPLVPAGATVMDIGANVGFYSLCFSRWVGDTGRVFSFEPTPVVMRRLRRHCELNGIRNIHALEMALSDGDGVVTFQPSSDGQSHVVRNADDRSADQISVTCRRLDFVVQEQRIERLHFLKIDVENHEAAVLRGARETLRSRRPSLLIEIHSFESLTDCASELYAQGYSIRPIGEHILAYERILAQVCAGKAPDPTDFHPSHVVCTPNR